MSDGAFVDSAFITDERSGRFDKPNAKMKVILQLHNAKEYYAKAYLNFNGVA